jgi:hypothetical protein
LLATSNCCLRESSPTKAQGTARELFQIALTSLKSVYSQQMIRKADTRPRAKWPGYARPTAMRWVRSTAAEPSPWELLDDPDVEPVAARVRVDSVDDEGRATATTLNELIVKVWPRDREPPGPDPSPLKDLAIEAAISLRRESKRITTSAVRTRLKNSGTIVPHTDRQISSWIRPFRK